MEIFLGVGVTQEDVQEVRRKILHPREELLAVATGNVVEFNISWKSHLVVLTDSRVIFFGRNVAAATVVKPFSYANISSVFHYEGLTASRLDITIDGKTEKFHSMKKKDVDPIIRIIRHQIDVIHQTPSANSLGTAVHQQPTIHVHISFKDLADALQTKGLVLQSLECPKCHAQINFPQEGNITTCSFCNTTIHATDITERFAQILGMSIKTEASIHSPTQQDTGMIYCIHCGTRCPSRAKYCRKCGKNIAA